MTGAILWRTSAFESVVVRLEERKVRNREREMLRKRHSTMGANDRGSFHNVKSQCQKPLA